MRSSGLTIGLALLMSAGCAARPSQGTAPKSPVETSTPADSETTHPPPNPGIVLASPESELGWQLDVPRAGTDPPVSWDQAVNATEGSSNLGGTEIQPILVLLTGDAYSKLLAWDVRYYNFCMLAPSKTPNACLRGTQDAFVDATTGKFLFASSQSNASPTY